MTPLHGHTNQCSAEFSHDMIFSLSRSHFRMLELDRCEIDSPFWALDEGFRHFQCSANGYRRNLC